MTPTSSATRTMIAAGVPIPIRDTAGELVAVVASATALLFEDGRLIHGDLELTAMPDVFARWKADPSLTW